MLWLFLSGLILTKNIYIIQIMKIIHNNTIKTLFKNVRYLKMKQIKQKKQTLTETLTIYINENVRLFSFSLT